MVNLGAQVWAAQLDVCDATAFKTLAIAVKEKWGTIDILGTFSLPRFIYCLFKLCGSVVNNAGLMLMSHMRHLKTDEWSAMIDTNIKGVLNGIAAVLPTMRQQKHGHIINISSDADRKTVPGSAVYRYIVVHFPQYCT